MMDTENKIAKILRIFAYIIFSTGAVMGLMFIGQSILMTLGIWFSSFVTGVFILALAEIIALLNGIYERNHRSNLQLERFRLDLENIIDDYKNKQ